MRNIALTAQRGLIIHTGTGLVPIEDQTLSRLTVNTFEMSEKNFRGHAVAVQKLTGLKYTQALDMLAMDIGYENWCKYREVRSKIHRDNDGKNINEIFDSLCVKDEVATLSRALSYVNDLIKRCSERVERNHHILTKVTSEYKFKKALEQMGVAEKSLESSLILKDEIEKKINLYQDEQGLP